MGKTLKYGQSIAKCQKCQSPSIVDNNIIQCPRPMCGYIYCSSCGSFSANGPENFIDKCNSSILIVDKPKLPRRLTDSPPKEIDPNQLPFFLRDTTNLSYDNNNTDDVAMKKKTPPVVLAQRKRLSYPINLFQYSNRNVNDNNNSIQYERKPVIATVVPCIRNDTNDVIIEPSSPPKVINVACSKQSKKRIKRRLVI